MSLIIFYDSQCPLCALEMRALKRRDTDERLCFEDIWQPDFSERFPSIDPVAANQVLHAIDHQGNLLLGLDVTARAWSLIGVRRYNILRWPLIRPIADWCYRFFARNRYGISRVFTGHARCESGQCFIAGRKHSENAQP